MEARHLAATLVATLALLPMAGCGPAGDPAAAGQGGYDASDVVLMPRQSVAPTWTFPVGVRTVSLARGDRPLPTTIWYPAASGSVGAIARRKTPAAGGRFPLVIFSHGLSGLPQRYAGLAQAWASAGFVVAAPQYPHTSGHTKQFIRNDIENQPADAWYVIDRLRHLDTVVGDLLSGHVDAERVAAIGHSAGGFTTNGMFTAGHDARLVAGVVIAGWLAPGAFAGPPANLLFIHGVRDNVVPVAASRLTYAQVPASWPKSMQLLQGRWHSEYLKPGRPGFTGLRAMTTNFLRWNLYGDDSAHRRMPPNDFPDNDPPPQPHPAAMPFIGPLKSR
jgi:dienelactone hydrolase